MKCTKGSRRRHHSIVGPHVILKVVKEDDSFYQFSERYEDDKNWQWKEKLRGFRTDALFRDDPYGVDEFLVPYSLNKKRRWIIPEIVGQTIEEVQDPYLNLRVSASVHCCRRSNRMPRLLHRPWGWEPQASHIEDAPVQGYYDVQRDGTVVRNEAKHAHLNTFDNDTSHAKRPRTDPEFRARFSLPFDEKEQFQKVHIRFNILRLVKDEKPVRTYTLPPNYWRKRRRRTDDKLCFLREQLLDFNNLIDDDVDSEDPEVEDVVERPSEWTLADFLPVSYRMRQSQTIDGFLIIDAADCS